MTKTFDFKINELESMKKYPKELFYIGNTNLLKKRKVSIVGSRKPNTYSQAICHELSSKLSKRDICIVSGGAIGIDTISHKAAGYNNTIMVAGTGLDKKYPAINKKMIESIEKEGLIISQFKEATPSTRYNFPLRNELIVALGEILIVAYADKNSGTLRSIEYALKMNKKIYVLPHRIGESEGTNELIKNKKAEVIYDIDVFINKLLGIDISNSFNDEFLNYCKTNPSYEQAILKYGDKVFEYELNNLITINNGLIQIN